MAPFTREIDIVS